MANKRRPSKSQIKKNIISSTVVQVNYNKYLVSNPFDTRGTQIQYQSGTTQFEKK
jgi:hypothetical protein